MDLAPEHDHGAEPGGLADRGHGDRIEQVGGAVGPGGVAGRLAPVSTIGASPSWSSAHSTASSSSVSVPVVMTTPAPACAASRARRASSSAWSCEICGPGSESTFSA